MIYLFALLLFGAVALLGMYLIVSWMPGKSLPNFPTTLEDSEIELRDALQQDLIVLAQDIGERNVSQAYSQLMAAAEYIEQSLRDAGYQPTCQEYSVDDKAVRNVAVERKGRSLAEEVIVVGAHYDTVPGSPGANDNGSAVVANLALARAFAKLEPARTVRFVFFANEERPYYMTDAMGSLRYARECREKAEDVVCMICLETIGCYLESPESQRYPISLLRYVYPTKGNFIAVVSQIRYRALVRRIVRGLRRSRCPSEGIAAPRWLKDIFRSDHAAFWHNGYPALMITDTANFRYAHYHTAEDTVDKINFEGLACVVNGLKESTLELADEAK